MGAKKQKSIAKNEISHYLFFLFFLVFRDVFVLNDCKFQLLDQDVKVCDECCFFLLDQDVSLRDDRKNHLLDQDVKQMGFFEMHWIEMYLEKNNIWLLLPQVVYGLR